jgi:hypothetical protein
MARHPVHVESLESRWLLATAAELSDGGDSSGTPTSTTARSVFSNRRIL